jgi:hypothetical protein
MILLCQWVIMAWQTNSSEVIAKGSKIGLMMLYSGMTVKWLGNIKE